MRKIFAILTLFYGLAFLPAVLYAHSSSKSHVHDVASETQTFLNTDCRETDTCDLKRFSLYVNRHEVWLSDDPDPVYGTLVIAEYETDLMESLENYVFVQFVRGCVFDTVKLPDGGLEKSFGNRTPQFGEDKFACHPEWDIDSEDKDPVYYSRVGQPRHYYYMWGNFKNSNKVSDVKIYGEEKPAEPKLYVYDSPLKAFSQGNFAKNASYEFRTCIYRTKDVPAETEQGNINFAAPIHCFNWRHSYIYNHDLGVFESKKEIDPFCKEKPPPY